MVEAGLELCKNIISDLIVPAFCAKDGVIVCANKAAQDILPPNSVGTSVYRLFPEAKAVTEFSHKSFDTVSLSGIASADVSPLLDCELWQLTPEHSSADCKIINGASKTELNLLIAQINLLQRHCPEQKGLFASIYQNCCRLLKAATLDSKSSYTPILTVFDLSKEISRFVSECADVFRGLNISVETDELRRFTYISADRNILDDIFSGVLCLCSHTANSGGNIMISVTQKDDRALFSFSVTSSGPASSSCISEGDLILTQNILRKNLARLNGTLYSVSNGDSPAFIVSFPMASDSDFFSDDPVYPSVGIPAYLIQLSALLPPEFYSRLN